MKLKYVCMVSLALAVLTGAAGCQGHTVPGLGTTEHSSAGGVQALPGGSAPAGRLELPSPATLARTASAPPSDGDRLCLGAEWDALLPSNKVTGASFDPAYAGAAGRTLADAAYALYRFSNLQDYAGPAQLKLAWDPASDIGQEVYAGLANFTKNSWDWFKLSPTWTATLPGFTAYVDGSGGSVVAIVSLDNGVFLMDYLLLGGNTAPEMHVTSNLDSDPLQNLAPRVVSFDATASRSYGGSLVGFDFDWEGDGTWDELNDPDGLGIHQYQAGNFQCKIRATDNAGLSSTATLEFVIIDPANAAPTAAFTRTPAVGDGPLTVQLDASSASDTDGYITKYEWDFLADGTWDVVSSTPQASCVLAMAGANSITLRVTDNFFATATTTLSVTLNHGWHSNLINANAESRYRLAVCTTDTGTGPRACLAYQEFNAKQLRFVRALNAAASNWAPYVVPVITANATGLSPSMAVLTGSGAPIIAYGEYVVGGPLYVVSATDASGASWNAPVLVDGSRSVGADSSLAIINTIPCIAAFNGSLPAGQSSVLYYMAQDSMGTAWNEPLEALPPGPGITFDSVTLGTSAGGLFKRPLIACGVRDNLVPSFLYLSAALNIDGTAWPAPTAYPAFSYEPSLAGVNGRPAVCGSAVGASADCYFVRASDGDGASWPEAVQPLVSAAFTADMLVLNGLPLICYQDADTNSICAVSASDADGTTWGEPYVLARGISPYNCHLRMTAVGTEAVICYQYSTGLEYDLRCLSRY